MSRPIESELPATLLEGLSGQKLESVAAKVVQLITVDAAGWAHPAILSYWEVVAKDSRRLRLATYAASTTSGNMRRSGKATLVIIEGREVYYVKASAREIAPSMRSAEWNAAFECQVERVLVDAADAEREPGAYIATAITYHAPQRHAHVDRARAVIAELLQA